MKKALLFIILLGLSQFAQSQFITKPLNYPGPDYYPGIMHILDANNVWIATIHASGGPPEAYSAAVHTEDGGDTWIFDSIPMAGSPIVSDVFAWNSNIIFYVFTDAWLNGYIWKTTDGGDTWVLKTTNEFNGGFANFYHGFTADTGIAMGDPTNGSFEIQITNDGGDTWSRVPDTDIPAPMGGEAGINSVYTAVGNTIWFSTNKGRVFKSTDRGLHWTVSQAGSGNGYYCVTFTDSQTGVLYNKLSGNSLFLTTDGGDTWNTFSLDPDYIVGEISPMAGFEAGFCLLVASTTASTATVLFTPDDFETVLTVATGLNCSANMCFKDGATGWICGPGTQTDNILKFTGLITGIRPVEKAAGKLAIFPNPSREDALTMLPELKNDATANLQVFDISGHLIREYRLEAGTKQFVLHSAAYPSGTYVLRVSTGSAVVADERWVIQH